MLCERTKFSCVAPYVSESANMGSKREVSKVLQAPGLPQMNVEGGKAVHPPSLPQRSLLVFGALCLGMHLAQVIIALQHEVVTMLYARVWNHRCPQTHRGLVQSIVMARAD
jgi:hypothetical protein